MVLVNESIDYPNPRMCSRVPLFYKLKNDVLLTIISCQLKRKLGSIDPINDRFALARSSSCTMKVMVNL